MVTLHLTPDKASIEVDEVLGECGQFAEPEGPYILIMDSDIIMRRRYVPEELRVRPGGISCCHDSQETLQWVVQMATVPHGKIGWGLQCAKCSDIKNALPLCRLGDCAVL